MVGFTPPYRDKAAHVGWGEAHLSQIHVECLHNESSIAFHTQYNT